MLSLIINSKNYRRPFGVEREFFISLFFELKENEVSVSSTEELLVNMFLEQQISFTEVNHHCYKIFLNNKIFFT